HLHPSLRREVPLSVHTALLFKESENMTQPAGSKFVGLLFLRAKSWLIGYLRRHLFRDLEPYICTFRDCACKPFSIKHEWFSHELETHRNRWICSAKECEQKVATRQAFEHHYRSSHSGTFTEAQLPSIVESCCRPVEMIPAKACPLCNTWESRLRQRDPLNS